MKCVCFPVVEECTVNVRNVTLELMKNACTFLMNVVYCMALDATTYFQVIVCKQKVINNQILLFQSFIWSYEYELGNAIFTMSLVIYLSMEWCESLQIISAVHLV